MATSENQQMIQEKVVVLGGSFDPIHSAHLRIALESAKQCNASKAIFIPAHQSPLKSFTPKASNAQRLEMLRLALEDFPLQSEICTFELEQSNISYTINTARHLKQTYQNIYWIIGADQFQQLHKWKDIEELCKLVNFAILKRPDYSLSNALLPANICTKLIDCPQLTTSSSAIREKLANKDFLNLEIPQKLVLYIKQEKLYL